MDKNKIQEDIKKAYIECINKESGKETGNLYRLSFAENENSVVLNVEYFNSEWVLSGSHESFFEHNIEEAYDKMLATFMAYSQSNHVEFLEIMHAYHNDSVN